MRQQDKILIGKFIVIPHHNKICSSDGEVIVEPKIMKVLCYLIEHSNQVISKQQLLDALWPGQTLGQEVITRAIFELRKIFGDDAKQPSFISTVARKGYCFIHEITPETEPVIKSRTKTLTVKVSALILSSILLFLYWLWPNASQVIAVKPQLSLVSHSFEAVGNSDISPDGKRLLFVAEHQDEYLVVQKNIGNQQQTIVARANTRIVSPKWLTDTAIVYGQCTLGGCGLTHLDLLAKKFIELKYKTRLIFDIQIDIEQQRLLISNMKNGFRSFDIFNLVTSTLTILPKQINARKPVWANDYQQIFFLAMSVNGNQTFNLFDIATLKQTEINIAVDQVFALATMNKDRILLSSRKDGKSGIWQYAINQKKLTKLIDAQPAEVISELTYHHSKNLMIYKSLKRDIDIGVAGIDIDLASVNSDMIDMNALYLNKRDQLVLTSNRSGAYEIWSAKQGEVQKLTDLKLNVIDRPVFNDQQNQLAFTSTTRNMSMLRVFDLDTKSVKYSHQFEKKIYLLGWRHDQAGLYYSSGTQNNYTIYYFSFVDKSIKPVVINAGVLLHDDQQRRHFVNMTSNNLMVEQPNGEINEQVKLPENTSLTPHQAAVIDNDFYYIEQYKNKLDVMSVDLSNKQKKSVMELPRDVYVTQLAKQAGVFVIYDQVIADKNQLVVAKFSGNTP